MFGLVRRLVFRSLVLAAVAGGASGESPPAVEPLAIGVMVTRAAPAALPADAAPVSAAHAAWAEGLGRRGIATVDLGVLPAGRTLGTLPPHLITAGRDVVVVGVLSVEGDWQRAENAPDIRLRAAVTVDFVNVSTGSRIGRVTGRRAVIVGPDCERSCLYASLQPLAAAAAADAAVEGATRLRSAASRR